jgi:tRNA (mo5U34)-methyltransferase
MNREEIQARASKIQWFHNYELLPGIMTNGLKPIREEELETYFQIPQDLRGKRVLDVGCADGYYTFLAESRGASVVAIDAWLHPGFLLAHKVRGSKAEFRQLDVYELQPDIFGTFDIVFFTGVYYHLKNPILALERIANVTRELAIIESQIMTLPGIEEAMSRFYEPEELVPGDPSNRWVPNVPCLLQTVRAAGFPRVKFISVYADNKRGVVHAYKGPRTAAKMLTEDFLCTIHTPSANAQVTGMVQISGVVFSKLEQASGIERITVYLDKLDDPTSELGTAEYPLEEGSWRKSIAARFAGDIYGPIGFEFSWNAAGVAPGRHMLYILAEGKRGWHYAAKPIIVNGGSSGILSTKVSLQEVKTGLNEVAGGNISSSQQATTEIDLAIEHTPAFIRSKVAEIDSLGESISVSLSTQSNWSLVDQVRHVFHKLVIYYVNMLAGKQKLVNRAIAALLKQIVDSQERIEPDIAALQAEIVALRAEVQALQAKFER